ncbi:Crp/Fnr family transcriptional regulator [Erythrobacter litoralis]|uniref:Crp/Fnr family transcriptional regulator n=1 Tax=Erythrobacter litoralis TaxID=39960 RepID=UPI00243575EA|nr:Crp/Fnr family transcriptional regulator [Erythrobacter litoralis]MDG6080264.1 Crp/Fnr family transcriptional regulator [Erythrobacter litoralis]
MRTELFPRGRLLHSMSAIERDIFEMAVLDTIELPPRSILFERGQRLDHSYYVLGGIVGRHVHTDDGNLHLVGINIPGDFVDLHGFAMKRHDHSVGSLQQARLARFCHKSIADIIKRIPRLGHVMWLSALLDAAIHREWIFRLGHLKGDMRIAHFISEIIERARLVGLYDGRRFPFQLTQQDFAQACGMSLIHANRCFRSLYMRGFLQLPKPGNLRICDEMGLRKLSGFDSQYLYASDPSHI